jgi:hypothetical protein
MCTIKGIRIHKTDDIQKMIDRDWIRRVDRIRKIDKVHTTDSVRKIDRLHKIDGIRTIRKVRTIHIDDARQVGKIVYV